MKHILILPNGRKVSSGMGEDISIRSVSLTETVNAGEELTLGSVCATMAEVTILDPGGNLRLTAGDRVAMLRETDDSIDQVGIFILEKPSRKTANLITLTGYDNVTQLDKDLTAWLGNLNGWPYMLKDFAEKVCNACGLVLETRSFCNEDFLVEEFFASATGRQLMSWIAEVAGCFCRADPKGNIVLDWYSPGSVDVTPGGDSFFYQGSLQYEDYKVSAVEQVQINLEEQLWPGAEEGANTYIISGNPILSKANEAVKTALNNILSRLRNAIYTPCRVTVPAHLDIRPGQIVSITDANGAKISSWIMSRTRNGLRDTLECTGNLRRDSTEVINNKSTTQIVQKKTDDFGKTLTQRDILRRLTNDWTDKGIYLSDDGKLVVDASAISGILDAGKIIIQNLVAEAVRSVLNGSVLTIGEASIKLQNGGKETASLENQTEGVPLLRMREHEEDGTEKNAGELSPHHIKLGENNSVPMFYLDTSSGQVRLWLNGESSGKTLSWKDNGDGTYTPIGK